jgi:arylsulfatase
MELYAGFVEHTDVQVGKLVDFLDQTGQRDNTIIFYIWGDNGSSAEGQNGSISELLAQNQIPNTIAQQIKALDELGGLKALGGTMTDNIYHAGWAWAGSTPFRSTKLVAAHFGGTRNPLVVSWPKKITADKVVRSQFYHVNDIAPTLYEVIGIEAPKLVNGFPQDPIDGVSMAASFTNAKAPENKHIQYFDNNGSDGIYKDGWYACTFGPLSPWLNAQPGLGKWDSSKALWELYDLTKDFSQMHDLAKEQPKKVEEMKQLFLAQAKENKAFPIGAGIWLRIHPEDRIKTPYTSWTFDDTTTRMPEFTAPAVGNTSNTVTIDMECGADASGVLYAMGGSGGGLTCYMDKGQLVFEYNLMIIDRSIAKSVEKIAAGEHTVVVTTTLKVPKPGAPADIVLTVDGKEAGRTTAKMTVPAAFTASETFDVGVDLGSVVSRDYAGRRPFKFDGKIGTVKVELK